MSGWENPGFCGLADEWLEASRPLLKSSSYVKYRNIIRSYLYAEFGGALLSEIDAARLHGFCNHLLCSGGRQRKGLSAKTVADVLSVVRSVLRYADSRGFSISCSGKEITIRQEPPRMRVLTRREEARLCDWLRGNLTGRNAGILLCLFGGLRIGEVCALRWEDISWPECTMRIHQTMQRLQTPASGTAKTQVVITTPKSSCSTRIIPIPKEILTLLKDAFPRRSGFFMTGSETEYIEPRNLQKYFRRVLRELGLPSIRFHSLRHTFATRCVEVGFDIKSLSEILGHASISITMNRYVHPSMELKRKNMQRLFAECGCAAAEIQEEQEKHGTGAESR